MWANPASVLEEALPHSSPFHLPLILPGFCSRPRLPEATNACDSLPRCCEVRSGAEAVTRGRALSWGRGTRAGTSQGQPEEPGAANERPWDGAAALGLLRALGDRAGTADFQHGSSGAGAGAGGESPGASISACESGQGANQGRDGNARLIGSTSANQRTFCPPFLPLLFLPTSSSSSLRAAHLPSCTSYPHSPL